MKAENGPGQIGTTETYRNIGEQREKIRTTPVTLVIPPSPFLADQLVFPELGPLEVAAMLGANENPVAVLNLAGVSNYQEVMAEYVHANPNCVYGFSATTPQIPFATELARIVREEKHDAHIILGGAHATLTFAAHKLDVKAGQERRGTVALNQLRENFDTIVAGDGQLAIFYAIDRDFRPQDKVIDAGSRESGLFRQRGTIENYPRADRSKINLERYRYYIPKDDDMHRATSVIGQLGCPFGCVFCGGRDSDTLRVTRTRPVEEVIGEIEEILDMSESWEEPIRGIMFYDDELNVSPNALEALCRGLINLQERRGIDMAFRGFVKAELFTEEQAELMHRAGFRVILSGVESGSEQILTAIEKHTTPDINSNCVRITHEAGMQFKALMSIGHPGESRETIQASIDWARANLREGDDIDWTVITPYPGSPIYDRAVFDQSAGGWVFTAKNGSKLWSTEVDFGKHSAFYKGIPGQYKAVVWTENLTSEELVVLRDEAESETRAQLGLPTIVATSPASDFDHSMGQS